MGSAVYQGIHEEPCQGDFRRACRDEEEEEDIHAQGRSAAIPIQGDQGIYGLLMPVYKLFLWAMRHFAWDWVLWHELEQQP